MRFIFGYNCRGWEVWDQLGISGEGLVLFQLKEESEEISGHFQKKRETKTLMITNPLLDQSINECSAP